jgi:hypothetical protein
MILLCQTDTNREFNSVADGNDKKISEASSPVSTEEDTDKHSDSVEDDVSSRATCSL